MANKKQTPIVETIEQGITKYLIELAMQRKTTNYLDIAQKFGLPEEWPQLGQTLSPILYNIFDWCEHTRLPRLTVLVVRRSGEDAGIPGKGFWTACRRENLPRVERLAITHLLTIDVFEFFNIQGTH